MTRVPSDAVLAEDLGVPLWSLQRPPWLVWPREGAPAARLIIDNDFDGDPDDLFQLVHHLLSPSVEVSAVVCSRSVEGESGADSAQDGTRVVRDLSRRMGITDAGLTLLLVSRDGSIRSTTGTSTCRRRKSSSLLDSRSGRFLAISTGCASCRRRSCERASLGTAGRLGEYLYDEIRHVLTGLTPAIGSVEMYPMGDQPLVLLTVLQGVVVDDDFTSNRYVSTPTPAIGTSGGYVDRPGARPMRVFAKLQEFAGWQAATRTTR